MILTSYEHLRISAEKCKKNVIWKDSVASFMLNAVERIIRLKNDLESKTYHSCKPYTFTITSPKPREILSVCFKDRVFQRNLNDNILYPIMTKSFIYDNCACQINKGTDFARNRLKAFLQKYFRKYGTDGYVLQVDIKGYYPNMSHEYVEGLFKEKLKTEHNEAVLEILHSQYQCDKGYNAGSQLIQIAGISCLNKLDHYIKERLRIKYYLRYMDDFILIHNDKNVLEDSKKLIEEKLHEIGFEFNEKKTNIYKLTNSIDFLGFNFTLTDTGKVLMLVRSENIKREKRHLKGLINRCRNGKMSKEQVDKCFECWLNHISKGNSYYLINRMKNYYNELWSKDYENN